MSILLTIDDGPSETAKVKLEYLKNKGIKAIWFCLGRWLDAYPDMALRIINDGHVLANHSYSHPHFPTLSLDECRQEIQRTDDKIEELYRQAGISRHAKLFRFPYGEQVSEVASFLQELDYRPLDATVTEFREPHVNKVGDFDWLWSYDIQEWAIPDPRREGDFQLEITEIEENLKNYLLRYDHTKDQVILIHDHEYTAEYFPRLVDLILQADINFDTPSF